MKHLIKEKIYVDFFTDINNESLFQKMSDLIYKLTEPYTEGRSDKYLTIEEYGEDNIKNIENLIQAGLVVRDKNCKDKVKLSDWSRY